MTIVLLADSITSRFDVVGVELLEGSRNQILEFGRSGIRCTLDDLALSDHLSRVRLEA